RYPHSCVTCRWRQNDERAANAVSKRHSEYSGRAAARAQDHCFGCRLRCGSRGRVLAGNGRSRATLGQVAPMGTLDGPGPTSEAHGIMEKGGGSLVRLGVDRPALGAGRASFVTAHEPAEMCE